MVNYVFLKRESKTKKFSFETQKHSRSYNLMSSYNAIGGKINEVFLYLPQPLSSAVDVGEIANIELRNSHVFLE
jgi:Fe(3+) dicitrate transport protein